MNYQDLDNLSNYVNQKLALTDLVMHGKVKISIQFKLRNTKSDLKQILMVKDLLSLKPTIYVDCSLKLQNPGNSDIIEPVFMRITFSVIIEIIRRYHLAHPEGCHTLIFCLENLAQKAIEPIKSTPTLNRAMLEKSLGL
jgi:hypothetical protein